MSLRLKVNEAIARSEMNGSKVYKKDIAARLWPTSSSASQQVNMTKLCNGTTKSIHPDWVVVLCELLTCEPNYLFGYGDGVEK